MPLLDEESGMRPGMCGATDAEMDRQAADVLAAMKAWDRAHPGLGADKVDYWNVLQPWWEEHR